MEHQIEYALPDADKYRAFCKKVGGLPLTETMYVKMVRTGGADLIPYAKAGAVLGYSAKSEDTCLIADLWRHQYTDGPWKIHHKYPNVVVNQPEDAPFDGISVASTHDHDASEANARLISAAPDLLDAVQELMNLVGRTLPDDVAVRARAALAKAWGGRSVGLADHGAVATEKL